MEQVSKEDLRYCDDDSEEHIIERKDTAVIDDRFVKENGQFDFTLIVENYRIHVSRSVLCIASPVFRAMLESDFKEKSQEEVELHGKKYTDVVDFLNCLYPDRRNTVTDQIVYKVLPLASEYQVKALERKCEYALIALLKRNHAADVDEIFRHIQLAELYNTENLRQRAILLASEFRVEDIQRRNELMPISDKSLIEIQNIALKRHELDRIDDQYLLKNCPQGQLSFRDHITQSIGELQTSRHKRDIIRSGRLQRRFFPDEESLMFKRNVRSSRHQTCQSYMTDVEEAMLLPETFKRLLGLEDDTQAIKTLIKQ